MCRALLVEDKPRVAEFVGEILEHSLQHRFDVAGSNEDACRLLKANQYAYVLLDLAIPASSRGERPRIRNGVSLFQQIVRLVGAGKIPIIIMTSHAEEAFILMSDFQNDGLTFSLYKDRWDQPGMTVEDVVRKALDAAERRRRAAGTDTCSLRPFSKGHLVILADGATLCGRRILDDSSLSPMRELLIILSEREGATYKHFPRRVLTKRLDTTVEALGGVIYRFRKKVAEVLADECAMAANDDDVIRTKNGDHLTEKVTVELRLAETIESAMLGPDGPNRGPNGPDNGPDGPDRGPDAGSDFPDVGHRQKQRLLAVVGELQKRKKITKADLEAFSRVGRSQVTRDLKVLEEAGVIRRTGPAKARHYEFDPKWAAQAGSATSSATARMCGSGGPANAAMKGSSGA